MKAIKSTYKRNRSFLFLIAGIVFLTASASYYIRQTKSIASDKYEVLSFCETIPVPVFSVPEGIYDSSFVLEIYVPDGYDIFYTTDGSNPTVRSKKFKEPLTVDPRKNPNKKIQLIPTSISVKWRPPYGKQNHALVFRARCFKEGVGYGKTKNVIYSSPTLKQHNGFQVIHILIEADSLFNQRRGIYVLGEQYYSKKAMVETGLNPANPKTQVSANYQQRGRQWERPAELIVIDAFGKTLYEQSVRLRIHGGWTRSFPVKPLRVIADSTRGESLIHYRFFDELPYEHFNTILLRSGTDQYNLFADAMVQQMAKKLGGLDIQDYAPSVVYINGNYWGIHLIRERVNEHYLAIKYGAAIEKIHILDKTWDQEQFVLQYGDSQSLRSFEDLTAFIQENSMADEKAYQYVSTQMDIDNYIDYVIVETFFANWDWCNSNVRLYKIDEQTEIMKQHNIEAGKWRWLLFDFDWTLVFPDINMFDFLLQCNNTSFSSIFFGLLQNKEFKEKFLNRYEDVVKNHFTVENMLPHFKGFQDRYEYEMKRHYARWRTPSTGWWFVDYFIPVRPDIVLEQLSDLEK